MLLSKEAAWEAPPASPSCTAATSLGRTREGSSQSLTALRPACDWDTTNRVLRAATRSPLRSARKSEKHLKSPANFATHLHTTHFNKEAVAGRKKLNNFIKKVKTTYHSWEALSNIPPADREGPVPPSSSAGSPHTPHRRLRTEQAVPPALRVVPASNRARLAWACCRQARPIVRAARSRCVAGTAFDTTPVVASRCWRGRVSRRRSRAPLCSAVRAYRWGAGPLWGRKTVPYCNNFPCIIFIQTSDFHNQ